MPAGSGTTTGFTRNLGTDLRNDHPDLGHLHQRAGAARRRAARGGREPALPGGQRQRARRARARRTSRCCRWSPPARTASARCSAPPATTRTCARPIPPRATRSSCASNRFQEAAPSGLRTTRPPTSSASPATTRTWPAASGPTRRTRNPLVADETYTAAGGHAARVPGGHCRSGRPPASTATTRTPCRARVASPREGDGQRRRSPEAGRRNPAHRGDLLPVPHDGGAERDLDRMTTVPNIATRLPARAPHAHHHAGPGGGAPRSTTSAANFRDAGFVDCTRPTTACGTDFLEPRANWAGSPQPPRRVHRLPQPAPRGEVPLLPRQPAGILGGTPDAAGTHDHDGTGYDAHQHRLRRAARHLGRGADLRLRHRSRACRPATRSSAATRARASSTAVGGAYVTREYQICLKCHSDYGYSDNNVLSGGQPAQRSAAPGGTPAGTNNLTAVHQPGARSSRRPSTHRGEVGTTDSGAGAHRLRRPTTTGRGTR